MSNVFLKLHELAVWISPKLPMGYDIPLGQSVAMVTKLPKIVDGEHFAVPGKTGTGKTTFVKAAIKQQVQLSPWLNVYHLNSKKQDDFNSRDGKYYKQYDPPQPLMGQGQRQVWEPAMDDPEMYYKYFVGILNAGKPAIVNIDESVNLKCGRRALEGYELLLKQGRKPGIWTYTSTQEIAQAPRQMFSQASHIVGFRVWNAYDERILKQYLRISAKGHLPLSGKHSILYLRPDIDGEPKLFNDYRELVQHMFH